ncbi:MAG TPA: hypothetical protein VN922_19685 [Bacteroidia bacterium]|nr:hypothetical protein [Bacteroidia bacterium]
MADNFLSQGAKNATAQQLISWHDTAKQAMQSLVTQRNSIKAQIANMATNPDYVQADIDAAQALQDDIDNTAKAIVAAL